MAQTVLVTGGTGYVAGWCLVKLLQAGYDVRTTVRSLSREPGVRAAVAAQTGDTHRLTFHAADLMDDAGWAAVMEGCDFVLHVASPMTMTSSKDADALVRPAQEGTLRVLEAAIKAGVKRVVMTSSAAACNPGIKGDSFTDETVWTDPATVQSHAYRRSKLVAEQAAWAFMESRKSATELVTILPTAIFGPVLTPDQRGSVDVILSLMNGKVSRIPGFGVCVVDVRDLADVHIKAMTVPEAAGERFLATGEFLWMREIAATLRERLGNGAARVPTRPLPDFAFRVLALFNPALHNLLPLIGRKNAYSWAKAESVLGFKPRPARDTVAECGASLLPAIQR